jgi:hypothetical protein
MVIPHPVLQSNGRKDTAIAVADPTVTFLESGPNVGVLLSSHTVPTKEGYSLHEVTWIRCVPKAGLVSRIFNRHVMQQREFKGVLLERFHGILFVARENPSGRYFPYPRKEPFLTRHLNFEVYENLLSLARQAELDEFCQVLGVTPERTGLLRARNDAKTEAAKFNAFTNLLVCA